MNSEIIFEQIIFSLPVIFLYAELHFRFKWFISMYFIKEPEIITDVPYRIDPNKKIPILILIKDAKKYLSRNKLLYGFYKN